MEMEWVVEHVRIEDLKEFSLEKRVRKKLMASDKMIAEFVCYEAGQGTPQHPHPRQDEIFYVVEGNGTIIVEDEEIPVSESSLIMVPAGKKHGIQASEDSRLVVMFIKASGSTASGK